MEPAATADSGSSISATGPTIAAPAATGSISSASTPGSVANVSTAENILPPEGIYESREALFTAINSWAKPRGYAFTTGKSAKTSNGRLKVFFACDRNKQPPNLSAERIRRTLSRGTGCKFLVLAKESLDKIPLLEPPPLVLKKLGTGTRREPI